MYALPQGCSAKREIILNEPGFVHTFYLYNLVKTLLLRRGPGIDEKPNDFSTWTKAPPGFLKLKGRRRC